jgi:hypothetical protein
VMKVKDECYLPKQNSLEEDNSLTEYKNYGVSCNVWGVLCLLVLVLRIGVCVMCDVILENV